MVKDVAAIANKTISKNQKTSLSQLFLLILFLHLSY
jgi:hypothetical protein